MPKQNPRGSTALARRFACPAARRHGAASAKPQDRVAVRGGRFCLALILTAALAGCAAQAPAPGPGEEVPSAAVRAVASGAYISPFATPDPRATARPADAPGDPNAAPADSVRVDSALIPADQIDAFPPDADLEGESASDLPAGDGAEPAPAPAATDAMEAVDPLDPIGVTSSFYRAYRQENTRLEVYALEKTATLGEAVRVFTRMYPRMDFTLSVGMNDAPTVPDALDRLDARMRSGDGPDVLMLDGLPMRALTEGNRLMDISAFIPEDAYPSIAGSYRQDSGAAMAIPARFFVTTILGDGVGDIQRLPELADWLEDKPKQDIGIGPRGLMRMFLPIYADEWMPGRTLDEARFRADLEALGRISRMFLGTSSKNAAYRYNAASVQTYYWIGGEQAAAVGSHGSVSSLTEPFSALHLRKGELRLLSERTFTPATIVSVNAATKNAMPMKNWMRVLFSDEVQGTNFDDGFPVRREILRAQIDRIPEHAECRDRRMSLIERELPVNLHKHWLEKAEVVAFADAFEGLTLAAPRDSELLRVFEEGTLPYLLGEATLDRAMAQVRQGLEALSAETPQ